MKLIYTFIFGERAIGEKPKQPTFKSVYPTDQPVDFNDWIAQTLNQLRSKRKKLTHKKKVARLTKQS